MANDWAEDGSAPLEALLQHLKIARGFDFTGYKRTTLERRIQKRMTAVGAQDYGAYLDFLEVHPEEFPALFNTILINVTSLFRDPEAWSVLERDVLPGVLARKGRTRRSASGVPDAPRARRPTRSRSSSARCSARRSRLGG